MASFIVEVPVFLYWMRCAHRRWTVCGDVTATFMVLCKRCKGKEEAECEKSDEFLHAMPFSGRPIF
jgi:hypothetical protein